MAASLIGSCVGCGRKDGIYHAHRDEHLCPRCGNMYELGDLAQLHLEQILDPALEVWRQHWLKRGVEAEVLTELLEIFPKADRSRHPLHYREAMP